jgi:hypothetical protein
MNDVVGKTGGGRGLIYSTVMIPRIEENTIHCRHVLLS